MGLLDIDRGTEVRLLGSCLPSQGCLAITRYREEAAVLDLYEAVYINAVRPVDPHFHLTFGVLAFLDGDQRGDGEAISVALPCFLLR